MTTDTAPGTDLGRHARPPIWVVGCDDSENARQALSWAAHVAAGRNVCVRAVVALEYPGSEIGLALGEGAAPLIAEAEHSVAGRVERLAAELRADCGTDIEVVTAGGGPATVLLDASDDAAMVVVGCRGRGGFKRLLLGSVSHQVATHAMEPCVIVPTGHTGHGLERIVVGVDGSDTSVAALVWAHEFAGPDAELCAAGFWEPAATGYQGLDTTPWDVLRAAASQGFETGVARAEAQIGQPRRFDRFFEVGPAAPGLIELAADRDLLVVGERANRGVAGALLGSVSNWVIHHLRCPGVVIPAPEPAPGA